MAFENAPITTGDDEELRDPLADRPSTSIAAPIGAVAARGFYWLAALSVVTKLIGTVTQVVLSRFVGDEEFGQIGTALTIASFIWLIQDAGLTQILIKRERHFARWCTPVFWFSILLGLIAAVLTAGSGPFAARMLHQPIFIGLMAILGLRGLLSAPSAVPVAALNNQLRFEVLAILGLAMLLLERGLMIFLTSPWVRWGAYGWIIALTIVSGSRTVLMWWYGRPPVKWQLQARRWKYFYHDSWLLTMALGFQTIAVYGDNLFLTIFRPTKVVGDYYWAYNLSLQTVILLTSNLGSVLFPTFSKLQREPERMRQGFIRAARMLTMIGVPGCFLQAALAKPIILLVFGSKWLSAAPALSVLSLGMAFGLVNYPVVGMLRAQGRFDIERTLSAVCAGIFLVAAFLGAWLGGSLSMAIAVAIYNLIAGLIFVRIGIGRNWWKIISIFLLPTVCSAYAIGLGYVLSLRINGTTRVGWMEQVAVIMLVGGIIYTISARLLMHDTWNEAMPHLRGLARRMGRFFGTGSREAI